MELASMFFFRKVILAEMSRVGGNQVKERSQEAAGRLREGGQEWGPRRLSQKGGQGPVAVE